MAEGKTPYPVRITTPEGVLFDDEAQLLIVTGSGGQIGFYARHAPLVADLKMGYCKVQLPDGEWRTWATAEGFASVHDSTAVILVEEAVESTDIDAGEVDKMVADAQARLEKTGDDEEYAADRSACEKTIAWGQHLKHLREDAAVGATH